MHAKVSRAQRIAVVLLFFWVQAGLSVAAPCFDNLQPVPQTATFAQLSKALPKEGHAALVFLARAESPRRWGADAAANMLVSPAHLNKISKEVNFSLLSEVVSRSQIKGSSIYPTLSEKNSIYQKLGIDYEEKIKQKSLFANHPGVQSVGSNADYKGNKKLPAMVPHVLDEKGCIKPLSANEITSLGRTLTVTFQYAGFSEVAMLVKLNENTKSYEKRCSAVIVSNGYALTARHCFELLETNQHSAATDYALLVGPKQVGDSIERCADGNTTSCPYKVLKIGQPIYPILKLENSPLDSAKPKLYVPDVALIPISDPLAGAVIKRVASIRATPALGKTLNGTDTAGWLTLMGYGLSNVAKTNEISGGYWIASYAPDVSSDKNFALLQQDFAVKYVTRFCAGDSGGPVFMGTYTGGESEDKPRVVGALMHRGTTNAASATCAISEKSVVQLLTDDVKKWICDQSKEIAGCN